MRTDKTQQEREKMVIDAAYEYQRTGNQIAYMAPELQQRTGLDIAHQKAADELLRTAWHQLNYKEREVRGGE